MNDKELKNALDSARLEGVKFALDVLLNKTKDLSRWSHSRNIKFAPVELHDLIVIEWKKHQEDLRRHKEDSK